jgi:hypothetical protein
VLTIGLTVIVVPLGTVVKGVPPLGTSYHNILVPGSEALNEIVLPGQALIGTGAEAKGALGTGPAHCALTYVEEKTPNNSKTLKMNTFFFIF